MATDTDGSGKDSRKTPVYTRARNLPRSNGRNKTSFSKTCHTPIAARNILGAATARYLDGPILHRFCQTKADCNLKRLSRVHPLFSLHPLCDRRHRPPTQPVRRCLWPVTWQRCACATSGRTSVAIKLACAGIDGTAERRAISSRPLQCDTEQRCALFSSHPHCNRHHRQPPSVGATLALAWSNPDVCKASENRTNSRSGPQIGNSGCRQQISPYPRILCV